MAWPLVVLVALLSIGIGMLLVVVMAQGGNLAKGRVPRRQWPAEGGAAAVATTRSPVVLEGSPVTHWAALSRWSPEHVSAYGPSVLKLVWRSAGPCLVYTAPPHDSTCRPGSGHSHAPPCPAPLPHAPNAPVQPRIPSKSPRLASRRHMAS